MCSATTYKALEKLLIKSSNNEEPLIFTTFTLQKKQT